MSSNGNRGGRNIPSDFGTPNFVPSTLRPPMTAPPPLSRDNYVPEAGPQFARGGPRGHHPQRSMEENRRRPVPIAPGNHERAWNDPPMFSLDANTRSPGRSNRLTSRVGFPVNPTPTVPQATGRTSPSSSTHNNNGLPPLPPTALPAHRPAFVYPPMILGLPPLAVPPRPFIPVPPPPPPGSGDFGHFGPPLPIFYGNLPHAIIPPHELTPPIPNILNHPNILEDS